MTDAIPPEQIRGPATYVSELEAALAADLNASVTATDLLKALRPVAQALDTLERHRETLAETVKFVDALQERLMIVDERPESAPLGSLIRVRTGTLGERATLYLGNGPEQPLSRLVPQALP